MVFKQPRNTVNLKKEELKNSENLVSCMMLCTPHNVASFKRDSSSCFFGAIKNHIGYCDRVLLYLLSEISDKPRNLPSIEEIIVLKKSQQD